jgi:ethanolamine ammonia-lyase large subunit
MLLRTKLHGKSYEFPDLRVLMGKANEEKSGDRLAGVAAETAAERVAARLVLAEVPLWVLRATPAAPYDQDEVTRIIHDALNARIYGEIKDWTVGQLREWILADTTTGEMIRRVSNGLTAEMISAVTKLMSNLDLMLGASKLRVSAHCNNTIGLPGRLSSRNQPNHPTDAPEGIRAEIYEGLSYGSGDSVIGINPVDDSYSSVARLLDMTYDVIQTWQIPTQNCILSHVTTQMKCLESGSPVGLVFQSIAGSQKGNESFGISVGMLDEAYALARKHCFPTGRTTCTSRPGRVRNCQRTRITVGISSRWRRAVTGWRSATSRSRSTPSSASSARNISTMRGRFSAPGWRITSWASSPACRWASMPATPTTPAPTRTPSKTWR